jgi:hypothetical protein
VLDPFNLPAFIHKRIVLNLEDFGGPVEVRDSRFEKNSNFIPTIAYQYQIPEANGNSDTFFDSKVT